MTIAPARLPTQFAKYLESGVFVLAAVVIVILCGKCWIPAACQQSAATILASILWRGGFELLDGCLLGFLGCR